MKKLLFLIIFLNIYFICFSVEFNYDGCEVPYTDINGTQWGVQMLYGNIIAVKIEPEKDGIITGMKIFCEAWDRAPHNSKLRFHIYLCENGEPTQEILESYDINFPANELNPNWHYFIFEQGIDYTGVTSFYIGVEFLPDDNDLDGFLVGACDSPEGNQENFRINEGNGFVRLPDNEYDIKYPENFTLMIRPLVEYLPNRPQPPKNLRAFAYKNGCFLIWDASETEGVKYNLYRSEVAGKYNENNILFKNQVFQSWEDLNLEEGKTYYYVVRAVKENVESENSNEVSFTYDPFEGPKNLRIFSVDKYNRVINLQWNKINEEGITYSVYRVTHTSGGNYQNILPIKENIVENFYADTNIEYSTRYFYVVRAKNKNNIYSKFSNEVSVIIHDPSKLFAFNSELNLALERLAKLDTLINPYEDLDNLQKIFIDFLRTTIGDFKKGYDVKLIRSKLNNWQTTPPDNLESGIQVLKRLNLFLLFLCDSFSNEDGQIPGIKNVAYEGTSGFTESIKNIWALLWLGADFYEQLKEINQPIDVIENFDNMVFETIKFLADLGLEFLEIGGADSEAIRCFLELSQIYFVETKDKKDKSKSKIGLKDIARHTVPIVLETLSPYFTYKYTLEPYFKQYNFIDNCLYNLEFLNYTGDYFDAMVKTNKTIDTVQAITLSLKNSYNMLQTLITAISYSNQIVSIAAHFSQNPVLMLLAIKIQLATTFPIIIGEALVFTQRNNFLFEGTYAYYYFPDGKIKYCTMPSLAYNAYKAAFYPDQHTYIASNYVKNDNNHTIITKNIKVEDYVDFDIIHYDTLLLLNLKDNIANGNVSLVKEMLMQIEESEKKVIKQIQSIYLPALGIKSSNILFDSIFYKSFVQSITDIELLKSYRFLVSSSIYYYLSAPDNTKADTIYKYLNLYLNNISYAINNFQEFLNNYSDKISYPLFDIISASPKILGNDQYEITIKLKNYGANLNYGKIKISYICDESNLISEDTISITNIRTLSEIEIKSKALLISSTGKVYILVEYLFEGSRRCSSSEFTIPITPLSFEDSKNYIEDKRIKIIPNPANDYITIKGIYSKTNEELIIYNIFGQKVYNSFINSPEKNIDISSFPTGAYLVVIGDHRGIFLKR